MASPADQKELRELCEKFKTDKDVTLGDVIDSLNQLIPNQSSQEYADWKTYIDELNEAWMEIVKEKNTDVSWPKPPGTEVLAPAVSQGSAASAAAGSSKDEWTFLLQDAERASREKIRNERKLLLDGAAADGVGPARQPKARDSRENGKSGRKADALADLLAIKVVATHPTTGENKVFRFCIACDKKSAGFDPSRIKHHAQECATLVKTFPSLYKRLRDHLAGRSHTTKLVEAGLISADPSTAIQTATRRGQDSDLKQDTVTSYMQPAKLGEQQRKLIELNMFKMFICCALPWSLLDNPFFWNFVHALNKAFSVPDRSAFFPKLISDEESTWAKAFRIFIDDKSHLTMSLDGWSTRKKDEIYTFHTTTPQRRSIFTNGRVLNGQSVTGQLLAGEMNQILGDHDPEKYGAVVGDGGSNVRAAKIKVHEMHEWIINIYDPSHNLSLYMKDVAKIFKEPLSTVSSIANYFGKSNYGTHQLGEQRKKDGVKRGIKSHSDTRFSSSYNQVVSVSDCMTAIKTCMKTGDLKFDTAATKKLIPYLQDGNTHYKFMSQMTAFIEVESSGANGILTLEGQNTTCADVFYVWVCIAVHLEQVLSSEDLGLTPRRGEIIGIYNHRFNQMMSESSHKIFLLGYFLHPLFHHHGGLQLTMPVYDETNKVKLANYPSIFQTLLASALEILRGEQKRLKNASREVIPEFIRQFIGYCYNHEPFRCQPFSRGSNPLEWWNSVSFDSNAKLLSVAIKVFSICPSEICDERTASKLGWFNAARRSSLTPEHLVSSARLHDYYVNGLQDGNTSEHTARVHVSNVTPSHGSTTFSAPSLEDLLNIDNLDPMQMDQTALERELFENPDPYDLSELDRVDEALQPMTIIRTSNTFAISEYVKLHDSKLRALVRNVDSKGPGANQDDVEMVDLTDKEELLGEPGEWDIDDVMNSTSV